VIRHVIIPLALFVACTSPGGQNGTQGAKGDQGAQGNTGATGAPGPSGVCDTSSCASISSIDGLSGGTISGTTTLNQAIVSGELTLAKGTAASPRGVVVERGNRKTSVAGFYCGTTSFNVFGTFASSTGTPDYGGLQGTFRVSKKHCEDTCQGASAHACKPSEVRMWQELGGGSSVVDVVAWRNSDVPMPAHGGEYWLASDDIVSDCVMTGSGQGLSYKLPGYEGTVAKKDCSTPLPLICCW
jgi:hypothetical protein